MVSVVLLLSPLDSYNRLHSKWFVEAHGSGHHHQQCSVNVTSAACIALALCTKFVLLGHQVCTTISLLWLNYSGKFAAPSTASDKCDRDKMLQQLKHC